MGFLTIKSGCLSWEEAKEQQDTIKQLGILQAIKLFDTFKDLNKPIEDLKWGEEIEYHVCAIDHIEKKARIHIEGFDEIQKDLENINQDQFNYQAEFGSWMVEAVPLKPYTIYDVNGPINALSSLIKRRKLINYEINTKSFFIASLSSFPNLGNGDFFFSKNNEFLAVENFEENNNASKSSMILDAMTNPHPRFTTMMQYVRERRGKKVDIRVPLYPDENTGEGKIDGNYSSGEIYMDSQHFGMGCCCLQVTFETQNIEHAKYLHDSFIPLGPIFGALSASAPIFKGQLANWDFRWNVIRDSVDSRTDDEMDPNSENYIPKSRYSGMNHYLSDHPYFASEKINDGIKLKVNHEWYDMLKAEGMSERLAYHFASLFVHDSLVIFRDRLENDPNSTEHFENLNSTNWNSVRFKPPPSYDSNIGWRVEFRTLDVQITDYENAAYIALVTLMTRVINDFEVNLSLPISLSDINMERAHEVDAVTKQKFWFRKNIVDISSDYTDNKTKSQNWNVTNEDFKVDETQDSEFLEMSIIDILEGNPEIGNTGLLELIQKYMALNKFSENDKHYYNTMLNFLVKRAKGEIKTGARFMRDFVINHKEYKKDSMVTDAI
jgi:glutamate--cysteine ligase catalytic subunit